MRKINSDVLKDFEAPNDLKVGNSWFANYTVHTVIATNAHCALIQEDMFRDIRPHAYTNNKVYAHMKSTLVIRTLFEGKMQRQLYSDMYASFIESPSSLPTVRIAHDSELTFIVVEGKIEVRQPNIGVHPEIFSTEKDGVEIYFVKLKHKYIDDLSYTPRYLAKVGNHIFQLHDYDEYKASLESYMLLANTMAK